jgi:hypothetical protein
VTSRADSWLAFAFDTTASTRDDRLLSLPFDQYQRYWVAAELVTRLEVPTRRPVVDVGGGPGLAEAFLRGREAVAVDCKGSDLANGRLPFADRSFAVGLALDALEHLDSDSRTKLVGELCRLSDVVVISAPFSHPSVTLAEAALHEFVAQRFADVPSLGEPSAVALPDLDETVSLLATRGWATATLPSGYLPRWLAGMLFRHELLAGGTPEVPALNAFYNATVSPFDCREPSYRHVVLASRDLPAEHLASVVDSMRFDADDTEGEVAVQVLIAALLAHGLKGPLESSERETLRAEIDRLGRELSSRGSQIADLRQLNNSLQAELQSARDATLREARRSISSVLLQRASDWRARRHA